MCEHVLVCVSVFLYMYVGMATSVHVCENV